MLLRCCLARRLEEDGVLRGLTRTEQLDPTRRIDSHLSQRENKEIKTFYK